MPIILNTCFKCHRDYKVDLLGMAFCFQGQKHFCIVHWHFGLLGSFAVLLCWELLSSICFKYNSNAKRTKFAVISWLRSMQQSFTCCHPLASKSNVAGSSSWQRRDNNLECVWNSCLFQCFPEGMERMISWTYTCSTDPTNSRGFYC